MKQRPSRLSGLAGWLAVLCIVGGVVFVATQRYAISDWFALRGYAPSTAVSLLVQQTSMTSRAQHLFYINHPAVEDKANFRQNCDKFGEQTIILGCYLGVQHGIHVLEVSDARLQGVEQVTAAHEMLHAAYDRLSGPERQRINGLLQEYADNQLKDERLIKVLESYQKTEPGQQLNEMHSIFGTEVTTLPDQLETYYRQYFTDRHRVAQFASQYQAAFTNRQAAIAQYDSQLKALSQQIKANTATLTTQSATIEGEQRRLDGYRQAGDISQYNAGVEPFNARVNEYNALLSQTKVSISQYNQLVATRNSLAAETASLQQAIDSSILPNAK